MALPGKGRLGAVWLLVAAFVLIAAACSAGDNDMAATATTGAAYFGDADEGSAATPVATTTFAPTTTAAPSAAPGDRTVPAGLPGTGGVIPALQPQDIGRDIVFTADVTIAVPDVATATEQATRAIEQLGGLLFGQRSTGLPEPQSVLTFKVFPEDFSVALDRLGSIGDIRSQNVSADDVTERIVDIESRIKTAAASVERLQVLLEKASDINTVAQLEGQLLQRETDLERLRGQLRTVEDQVSLATIVLIIAQSSSSPSLVLGVSAYLGADDLGLACPGDNQLTLEAGTSATLCFWVKNTGDRALAGIEIRDPVIGIETDDLAVAFGDSDGVLEPGEAVVLTTTIEVDRDTRLQTTATAVPVDADGTTITATVAGMLVLNAVDPGALPGFRDAVTGSWDVLKDMGGVALVVLGAVVPFLWLLALAGGFLWWRRRKPQPAPSQPAPTTP